MPTDDRAAVGWSVLLPNTWFHVHLDDQRQRRVATLVGRAFAGLPRDSVFRWRRELEQQITALLDDAIAEGGSDVYLLVDPRYGLPLAATGMAVLMPVPVPDQVQAGVVAHTLAGPGDRAGVLVIDGQECAAIRRSDSVKVAAADVATAGAGPAAATLAVTCLDVFVPVPGRPGGPPGERSLLLSFRTPVAALAEPMMILFEAIAQSLCWTWDA